MAEMSLWDSSLPAAVLLGLIAAGGYVLAHARHRQFCFTILDALIVTAIMAIVTAVAMPLVTAAGNQARTSALLQNLHTLRARIELYKLEHKGAAPLLYEGTFPQLCEATNAEGVPGPPGKTYPYGPYFVTGIPVNPYTGVSIVTPTATFPPEAPSGAGGWLFHQPTGQISPDLDEHLRD
jgi:type II secretory pathway pseudopilin PulG